MASAKVGHRESMINNSFVCYRPKHITSNGIQYLHKSESILEYSFPLLILQVGLIFAISRTLHFFLKPLRQPLFVSQILTGIILGRSLQGQNLENCDFLSVMFNEKSTDVLLHLATMGFVFRVFALGVKMDLSIIWTPGIKSIAIGGLGVIIPAILADALVKFLISILKLGPEFKHNGLDLGAQALAKTLFPVVSILLTELKMLNSELGRLALSSAMVSELLGLIMLVGMATVMLSDKTQQKIRFASKFLGSVLAFVCLILLVVPRLMRWMIRQTQEGKPVKEKYILSILMAVMVSAFISFALGVHVLLGPFILGMAVPDGPPLGSALVSRIESFTSDFLMSLFITICGLQTDLRTILDRQSLVILLVLIIFTFLGKIAGVMLPCLYFKIPLLDALTLTFIMCAKGFLELFVFNFLLESKAMDTRVFTIMVTSVVVAAGIVTPLVEALYETSRKSLGYNDRSIQYSNHNSELRILACVHEQDNVPTIIKLLEASNPTSDNPIYVCVLHLIELIGRAAPILISHQLQISNLSSAPGTKENVINAFQNYEQQNKGIISVKAFTSISPPNSMHDEVRMLALDNRTSLIILPFHKLCFDYGNMSSGRSTLRNLNLNVLDTAPCSVGILVDRWHLSGSTSMSPMHSPFRVAVLFLGGADDREALAYSKRMADRTSVGVTVVRLICSSENDERLEWGKILDDEAIRDFNFHTVGNERVFYVEEEVIDGVQTAWVIHSMVNEFDLIMVGRRHRPDSPLTSGLTQWSECPELGSIGDILASSDIKSGISALVVQQQKW